MTVLMVGLWITFVGMLAESDDTLLTGFSGFVILCLIIWAIWHFGFKGRNGG